MHDLTRYLDAQAGPYAIALAEIQAGTKTSHWMWFIFPQIAGLGQSAMARRYAITSIGEARDYLAHPLLGTRLRTCVTAIPDRPVETVFGTVDAMKLRSSLTLFDLCGGAAEPFRDAIDRLFAGRPDPATLRLVGQTAAS